MKSWKRGLVMPMIIVFLSLSQLIYWGILRINQNNTQRYVTYIDYYKAGIQEQMIYHWQHLISQPLGKQLEEAISHQLLLQYDTMQIEAILSVIEQETQFGVLEIMPSQNYQRILIYTQEVLLPEIALTLSDEFDTLTINGMLTPENYPLSLDEYPINYQNVSNLSDKSNRLIENYLQQGYRLIHIENKRALSNWQYNIYSALSLIFNDGSSKLSQTNNNLTTETIISPRNFSRQIYQDLPSFNYMLRWQATLLEKEIPANN